MVSYERIKLEHLTKKEKQIYTHLLCPGVDHPATPPRFLDPHESQIVIAALDHQNPIALVIGMPVADGVWEIASLFVEPQFRRRHIGSNLVKQLEKELKRKESLSLLFNYRHALLPEMDPFLRKLGWEGRKVFALECFFQNTRDFHPPWFDRIYKRKNPKFQFFPWGELTDEEKTSLIKKEESGRFPAYYNPFQRGTFEPQTSFGMRYQGEVVGWCITHEYKPQFLEFFCIYSHYDLQAKGIPMQLLIHSIKASQKSPFSARFFVNFKQVSLRWIRTVAKRLAPYATHVTLYHQAWKTLVKKPE